MTALFKNRQQENLPARDRRDWNKIESLGELRSLIANDGYAASFQDMGQYRSALVRHMDNVMRTLAAGQSNVSEWRERMGKPADWPLHSPTDVERAMVAEVAELRAQQAAARGVLLVILRDVHDTLSSESDSDIDHFEDDEEERKGAPAQYAVRKVMEVIDMLTAPPRARGTPEVSTGASS